MSPSDSPWPARRAQITSLARRELGRVLGGRQALGLILLVATPVLIAGLRAVFMPEAQRAQLATGTSELAQVFHYFVLRLVVFFGCAFLFVRLFRGEILERSLHFVFLVPIERRVVVIGKYLGGVVAALALLLPAALATSVIYLLPYGSDALLRHLASGVGIGQVVRYLAAVVLATVAYGALFLLAGLFFRNPMVPAVLFLSWEMLTPFLPTFLKGLSVTYYLSSLYPVPVIHGPFAFMSTPLPIPVSVVILVAATAAMLWVAGVQAARLEITYSVD